ncbi:SMP-30 gluconolaconase LRE domain protein [Aspergillus tanneri]|uniref:SMP-30 gluconolaconase LRE domain protein n=1 Tax=Aspergillus tanneri TaxID=1220188 RepID=A0A5M9M3M1_9EURO|nr:SMP-30 gluconolaconase LRE domain protein [Aspergillus tanneri]KAA8641291.1 SMP-30 gluconolaconase LRE domain protein [Aspergillus tanneri]
MSLLLVPGLCQRGCGDAIKSTALLAATLASVAYAQAGDNTDVSPTQGDGGPIFTLPTFSDSATPPGGVTLTELPGPPTESPTASGTDSGTATGTGTSSGTQTGTESSSTASPTGSGSSSGVSSSTSSGSGSGSSTAVTSTTTRSSTSSASRTSDTSSTTSDGSSRTSSGTSSPSASPSDNAAAGFVDKNWAPWMLAYVAGVGLAL